MNSTHSVENLDTVEDAGGGWGGGTMGESTAVATSGTGSTHSGGGFGQFTQASQQQFVQSPPPVVTSTPDMYTTTSPQPQVGYISQFAQVPTPSCQRPSTMQPPATAMYGNTAGPTGNPPSSGYAAPIVSGGANNNTDSFMVRSQRAYDAGGVKSQQQPQYGGANSYAQRSQQAYGAPQPSYQQPPHVNTSGFAANPTPTNVGTPGTGSYMAPHGASLPSGQPTGMAYTTMNAQNPTYSGGIPQQQQQQQQQQPTYSAGSYTARSAAVNLYGVTQLQQQQPHVVPNQAPQPQQFSQPYGTMNRSMAQPNMAHNPVGNMPSYVASSSPPVFGLESTQQQQKILTDATRKVQEHAYYMKQAMEQPHINNLAVVLDRAAHMVGELGGPPHGGPTGGGSAAGTGNAGVGGGPTNTGGSAKLTPKNYYELYMRALEDMPSLEEYLIQMSGGTDAPIPLPPDMIRIVDTAAPPVPPKMTMRQMYECVQYCPRVVSRLYLQIAAGSALIRSGECGAKWVMHDLQQAVKCEQNPVRGLFLRNFLLTALRDKLPDTPPLSVQRNEAANKEAANNDDADTNNDDDSAVDYNVMRSNYKTETTTNESDTGTVKDSYEFVLANFMEMNKLWVRIQHLPGEGNNKDVRKRRERERNDLRILVGTNLVRLSQLECVTSKIYGEAILPHILEHIVTTGDPLSQAYLMDCLVQVFPDEYHIETLPILLNVCPRLRDKVNVRTILQGLMDRLAKYLEVEELLDESDTNQVKKVSTDDSFTLFDECVQKVYNARGPKLTHKEVIRLQTALLQFSIKCFPCNIEQVGQCINSCVVALKQANAYHDVIPQGISRQDPTPPITLLDDASVVELEKLLSIPLETLALRVLELEQYSLLIGFLPWANRRGVAISILKAIENSGSIPLTVPDLEQLFKVVEPLVRDEALSTGVSGFHSPAGINNGQLTHGGGVVQGYADSAQFKRIQEENAHVSKLIHSLEHTHTDMVFDMLQVARNEICHDGCNPHRAGQTLVAVVFRALKLAGQVLKLERGSSPSTNVSEEGKECGSSPSTNVSEEVKVASQKSDDNIDGAVAESASVESPTGLVSCRKIFVFVQESIATLAKYRPEKGFCLCLDAAGNADRFASISTDSSESSDYSQISVELLRQGIALYEEQIDEGKAQFRCITTLCGVLLSLKTISADDYESVITKTAQFSAKVLNKPDQCSLVALCAHLFYPVGSGIGMVYSNAQRTLECLQRSLKLADACTSTNPLYVDLFVELLEHYIFFFEKRNPLITHAYVTGLVDLIKEHLGNLNSIGFDGDAKAHLTEVIRFIKQKSIEEASADLFAQVHVV